MPEQPQFREGDLVETTTTSGQLVVCRVIGMEGNNYVLESESHGYAILRREYEMKTVDEQEW